MKKNILFIALIALLSVNCFSQFSKTHYIPPVGGSENVPAEEQYLYVSTPSITPVNFIIKQLGGITISGVVSRDVPYVYNIGFGTFTQIHVNESEIGNVLNNKGFIIEAEDLVYVTARIIAGNTNQAGQITSKGTAALGTRFRAGGFLNTLIPGYSANNLTFISVLATENNTTVNFSDIPTDAVLINNFSGIIPPPSVVLNAGESYVLAVKGPTVANRDALIGALVTSDKPIAVNCGSYGGTNGEMANLDIGFDQIVSAERTGSEYIFIKSTGLPNVERVLLIADENNTAIFLNGSTTASYNLNAGEYIALNGADYNANGNLYVTSSKNIFAYQSVGDNIRIDQANQEMFFVPPLSCQTPKVINNIPFIEKIGNRNFTGRVTITTEVGATLNFIIDGVNYTLAGLPGGITVAGPTNVIGNTNYQCYTIAGLTGNVSVFSSGQLYLTAYGSDGAATFGGYYSGFTFKPEVIFQPVDSTQSNCIPNVELEVNTLSGFDTYQWFFNDVAIPTATSATYSPTQPGNYKVRATLSACGINLFSDDIPVSTCPTDLDNDSVNDNIDLDSDNDGITNCNESFGNQIINLSNSSSGPINVSTYTNSFTGTITTSTTASATPFVGAADGSFISEVPAGKGNFVKYTMTFAQPMSVGLEYITTAAASDLLNANAQYVVNSPINKTITVLNPSNQLLIDTNYDGIYESGVTEFSSFEIRFISNSTIPLAAGTGTFKFLTNLSSSISFTHKNLLDSDPNKVSLKFYATCVPKDSDNDGVADQMDLDSDNDSILDFYETQGANFVALSNVDANNDGIDDIFGNGITPANNDTDSVPNYLDLDSDNDGIFDIIESGSPGNSTNTNGDSNNTNFGVNGLDDALETSIDSGIINYTLADTDNDGIFNYVELDSDNDGCIDIIEAGYTDANGDGIVGDENPATFNTGATLVGTVISASGYGVPNGNYIIAAPITINTQPQDITTCELQNATFTVDTNPVNSYQWQISTDGGTTFTNLANNTTYSGVNTVTLLISGVTPSMNNYEYRVILNKNGNSCGLTSASGTLTTYALPVVATPVTLVQCDNDTDGISTFNLTEKNTFISANYLVETFTYFTSSAAANTNNTALLIADPLAYTSSNATVWVRVQNGNGCFRVVQLNLVVSITQLPPTFSRSLFVCDDYVDAVNDDRDGISSFNFSSVTTAIQAQLPTTSAYTINYYRNEADALAEFDTSGVSLAITDITNYRNIGYPNTQQIWVRVDSNLDNACYGLGPYLTLTVEALPTAYPVNATNTIRACDDDHDGIFGFDTSTLEATILNGQTNAFVRYFDASGNPLNPLPNPFVVNTSTSITVRVINNTTSTTTGACFDEETIQFIVDDLPQIFPLAANQLTFCDDEINPADQDGILNIDTTTILPTILQGQTGLDITFTLEDGTVLTSLPPTFTTGTQDVILTLTNPLNPSCPVSTTLNFVVNPVPKIELVGRELVCTNLPAFTVTFNAGILDGTPPSDYDFQWFLNGTPLLNQTNYSITVNTEGIYSVQVTNANGCSRTKVIEVVASDIASIQNIEVVDLVDINTIEVIVTGSGDYVYSLDDEYSYQESNFFNNVPMGLHIVYIKDVNGCGVVQKLVSVLGIPKYFTPNGDGIHDTWNIKGANSQFYPNSIIYIFDRFGKLIKQIKPFGPGWDGMYNGNPAPSDDYWFDIKFDDGRSAKGHFSLKR
ncbi:T9SS type B sorting domain-containing protein [Flavobacterium sp.]|uniref:T9SS type B sorting domain-containing protein n=1 Tax=Flavobacterium sp. TaxID=239 RepID=UPI000EDAEC8F|nr:T9SS type B sorting domain-containing protein [Flavobacterium sp.]HCQ13085.1 gliding motility protein [Flavobacterium sp.]